jgi:hypothetical protein
MSLHRRLNMKKCCVCKSSKPLAQFGSHAGRKDNKQTYCKDCSKQEQTKWYYKRKYGITLEERDSLLDNQDNLCAICYSTINFEINSRNIGNSAVIDHCHGKGHIRGVLCGSCNTGLGSFKDNKETLLAAISYLAKN